MFDSILAYFGNNPRPDESGKIVYDPAIEVRGATIRNGRVTHAQIYRHGENVLDPFVCAGYFEYMDRKKQKEELEAAIQHDLKTLEGVVEETADGILINF